jgi:hypothetical protein
MSEVMDAGERPMKLVDGALVPLSDADLAQWQADQASVAPSAAVPEAISFRQLILGLLGSGFLTVEQALAAAESRARPPQLEAIIATLPDEAALAARITWATIAEARRTDPLFATLIAAGHATEAQVDELFRQAVRL